jgi:hypothetical protein
VLDSSLTRALPLSRTTSSKEEADRLPCVADRSSSEEGLNHNHLGRFALDGWKEVCDEENGVAAGLRPGAYRGGAGAGGAGRRTWGGASIRLAGRRRGALRVTHLSLEELD